MANTRKTKVPGVFTWPFDGTWGRMWMQRLACDRCGEGVLHIEASPDQDEPYGVPAGLARCECGGRRVPTEVDGRMPS